MGRKKKRNKSVASENTRISSPKSVLKEAQPSAAPAPLPKKPSQVATYILCAIMFTAGVLAQKTFDRWKQRQDIAVKRAKQVEQGRAIDSRKGINF